MAASQWSGPVPAGLTTADVVLRPIGPDDAEQDYAAVMESRAYLRLWEQSAWPEDDFTVEADRQDLADLEQRHTDRRAFTFTALTLDGQECLGCVYVFPPGATFLARSDVTPLGPGTWDGLGLVAYFWMRPDPMEDGADGRLLAALRSWFAEAWEAENVVFVTSTLFTQQVELMTAAGLEPRFELREPDKPAPYLAFG